jgi:GntR family transcriptional regulator, transcriptional repressor for pyruvate dehydrogenase complex
MAKKAILLYETVIEYVKERIANGTYKPGQRLPSVSELAVEVGVGVSTVREGIRVLGNLGLVRVHQGQGMFVTVDARLAEAPVQTLALIEDSSLLSILEVRRIFEPEVAALAAERATEEQQQLLLKSATEQERQVHRAGDAILPEFRFHRLLLDAANNPVLTQMMRSVDELLLDSRRRTLRLIVTQEHSIHYHFLIAHAVQSRDAIQARVLMLQHVLDVTTSVKRYLANPAPAQTPPASAAASTPESA